MINIADTADFAASPLGAGDLDSPVTAVNSIG
jgi:hypothetical protein